MKKVKIALSTLAVMIAVVASLATNTAKGLALVTVSVSIKNHSFMPNSG